MVNFYKKDLFQTLKFKERLRFQKLNKNKQKELKQLFLEDEESALQETYNLIGSNESLKDGETNFRILLGTSDISEVTQQAFDIQNIQSKLNTFSSTMGMFTMNIAQQSNMLAQELQRKTDFVQIAQNDEIIKQNDKIIEQNDTMIELMKQIIEK
ncbi:hypothetical protein FEZ53_01705 [Staphylococcus xylosus]|uniref:Uncharacterized protein n=1 Tax=Staphylococcus xylosus TaxID=1288 RepID=A0A5R9B3T8_STAXY|nr:hypothetical protein [Staphylococcus xylosus]MEB6297568.1 hypothetical protein [Staphylococcus xylosus]TLP91009.1 hypothetical protein FEZ53_01705 [Staphylococcus xylosus]